MTRQLVLVTLTLEDTHRRDELEPVAASLGACVAVLQGPGPSLVGVLDRLAAERPTDALVRLVAVTCTASTTGRSWVGRVAGHWRRTRASSLAIEVSGRLARSFAADEVQASVDAPGRRVTGAEAALESPAWQEPPPYRHHVLVCRGPRCTAKGAGDVAVALDGELSRRGLLDTHVLVAQTGCLYPCNLAPTLVVHPAGTWYERVEPSDVPRIVAEDLT
ncbi:Ferredoxin [Nostocoides japonicum T1-X7]|uniref:Ferredoxin n=1 Tax=Nostocoides japonicum T1-X7 TaxID=1194083 RepID=A0A077M462_9MICO|nr:(2Fe-2S) ferredoxin domain-containing protein [Tetrasphaera japonica]CCH79877.1 Ferredoxin [Tetrasphaera japonica T1-X7]